MLEDFIASDTIFVFLIILTIVHIMKFFLGAVILFSIFYVYSCSKSSRCYYSAPPPSTLILKMNYKGQPISDSILYLTKLSYYENDNKKYVADFKIVSDTNYKNRGLVGTRSVGVTSADKGIKRFFFEYPNNLMIDTLHLDYLPYSPATNCMYKFKQIKFNSRVPDIDTTFHFSSPVYVLNKL